MQRLEVSCAVRPLYGSLADKGLILGAFAKLLIASINFVTSVHPNGTAPLRLDGFIMKFDVRVFFEKNKICQENSSSVKI